MRFILTFLAAVLAFAYSSAATYSPAQVPDVHRADRRNFVANPDGILSAQTVARLDSLMASMRASLTVEPMVVAVDDITDPADPDAFATDLFELWGLGKADKDNGLLFLFVKDRRKAVIRTGYGLEGALPDISCGRIIRNIVAPAAADGNPDQAVLEAVSTINLILSDPAVAEEFKSAEKDADSNPSGVDPFTVYIRIVCVIAVIMLVMFLWRLFSLRRRRDYEKYLAFEPWKPWFLVLATAGIGIPLVATIPLLLCLNHWRNHARRCPNCSARMNKVDEVHDNDYLTPAQDLEERIGSVDYDVWLCPDCGETDILAYAMPSSTFVECANCHARTARPLGYRVITPPTASRPGKGVKEYECLNCHNRTRLPFDIPPDPSVGVASAAAAGIILGGMGRSGGGFGGGGSFGGGFGGGSTGGGGASGGW